MISHNDKRGGKLGPNGEVGKKEKGGMGTADRNKLLINPIRVYMQEAILVRSIFSSLLSCS